MAATFKDVCMPFSRTDGTALPLAAVQLSDDRDYAAP